MASSRRDRGALFRSPRPDFIETGWITGGGVLFASRLFRSPRPDFIETLLSEEICEIWARHCSGLQDRTSLRPLE